MEVLLAHGLRYGLLVQVLMSVLLRGTSMFAMGLLLLALLRRIDFLKIQFRSGCLPSLSGNATLLHRFNRDRFLATGLFARLYLRSIRSLLASVL